MAGSCTGDAVKLIENLMDSLDEEISKFARAAHADSPSVVVHAHAVANDEDEEEHGQPDDPHDDVEPEAGVVDLRGAVVVAAVDAAVGPHAADDEPHDPEHEADQDAEDVGTSVTE